MVLHLAFGDWIAYTGANHSDTGTEVRAMPGRYELYRPVVG